MTVRCFADLPFDQRPGDGATRVPLRHHGADDRGSLGGRVVHRLYRDVNSAC